jgi:hypothetical protein
MVRAGAGDDDGVEIPIVTTADRVVSGAAVCGLPVAGLGDGIVSFIASRSSAASPPLPPPHAASSNIGMEV